MSEQQPYEPTASYQQQCIRGWTVYVSHRLDGDHSGIGKQVLELVRNKLYEVERCLPASALEPLRKVALWLELDGPVVCACYHPSKAWLCDHDFNPDKAQSIEIGNAANFLAWTHHQPAMVLHELAHAYHHQVLGYGHEEIHAAYQQAVDSGSYESVLRYDGQQARAYALNNDQEYFAELTESYFGTNDFYPFVRAELMAHDPPMHELLGRLWAQDEHRP